MDKKTFHAGGHPLMRWSCFSTHFPNFKKNISKTLTTFSHILIACLCLHEAARFMIFTFEKKKTQNVTLIWVGFLGVCFEAGGDKIPPCLKLVRIMLETWNSVRKLRKYTHIFSFRNKYRLVARLSKFCWCQHFFFYCKKTASFCKK